MKPIHDYDKEYTHEQALDLFPTAVADVEELIRSSRSKLRDAPFEDFRWFCSDRGETMTDPPVKCYRVYAFAGRLLRCSRLYTLDHVLIPDLWSF